MSFTGDSSRAGGNQPGPVGPFPRVAASPQEKAGRCVLVEEPETTADMFKRESEWEDRRKSHAFISRPVCLLKVLEGDPVPHACEGQESHLPWGNCPDEPMIASMSTQATQRSHLSENKVRVLPAETVYCKEYRYSKPRPKDKSGGQI